MPKKKIDESGFDIHSSLKKKLAAGYSVPIVFRNGVAYEDERFEE